MAQISIEKIKKEYPIKDVNVVHKARLSKMDKLALFVTQRIGTMGFFFIIFTWSMVWLGWNMLAPKNLKFDPYPAFVLWLFISNLIQLHLMPLLLIGQNVQSKHAELRSEHDFETDKKAEKEIEAILSNLQDQQSLILKILKKIEELEAKK